MTKNNIVRIFYNNMTNTQISLISIDTFDEFRYFFVWYKKLSFIKRFSFSPEKNLILIYSKKRINPVASFLHLKFWPVH